MHDSRGCDSQRHREEQRENRHQNRPKAETGEERQAEDESCWSLVLCRFGSDCATASMRTQAALAGVNAAVVGLLLAALYQPVWTSAIHQPQDFGLALVTFVALMFWKLPPWLVVVGSGAAGWLLSIVL